MTTLVHVAPEELRRSGDDLERLAALLRLNVLYMVKRAGSGHLGTSFSCLDLLVWLYWRELGPDDVFLSSKGHDAPAQYAMLMALGRLPYDSLHTLRRLGGLPGHPDVAVPGIAVGSGSLGMGISKAIGILRARQLQGRPARAFVLTGDGELQEGQNWEALATAAHARLAGLTVIVDRNRIQSDTWVERVCGLGDLEARFSAFGSQVRRCDGHDFASIAAALAELAPVSDRPKVLIADTVKGRGVSFMEAFGADDCFYGFHSGAPDDDTYHRAVAELVARVGERGLVRVEVDTPAAPATLRQRLVEAYGRELVAQAEREPCLVALDADLIKDCGLAAFASRFPTRLVECGISEQNMVSQAGGLARAGMLPVAHSFAAFLSARPNEQIYANATDRARVVYVGTLAGLLPGTPGHSHQAVRDLAALRGVPGLTMIAPSSERAVAAALDWCLREAPGSSYLRLCSIPAEVPIVLPPDWRLEPYRGTVVREGEDAVLIAYGPVMLAQACGAAERLRASGIALRVVDLPWLDRVDADWLLDVASTPAREPWLFTLDDHYVEGGQGEMLLATLAERGWHGRAHRFGVRGIPVCGQNDEVLRHHRLDANSLAEQIARLLAPIVTIDPSGYRAGA